MQEVYKLKADIQCIIWQYTCPIFEENLSKTCIDEIKPERMWLKMLIVWRIFRISSDFHNMQNDVK